MSSNIKLKGRGVNRIITSKVMLSPLAGVTDNIFRRLVRKWAPNSLLFTEMINATSLKKGFGTQKINQINLNLSFLTLSLITIICSICILYSLWFFISTTTIWFVKTWNAIEVLRSFLYIGRFPLNSFSFSLRIFFSVFIPIAFITTIPSEVFLGLSVLWKILLEVIVAIVFLITSRRFWLFALKFYSSASS